MADYINLPFAESGAVGQTANATTPSRPVTVSGGTIVTDTPGKALQLNAGAYAELTGANPVDLSKSFTLTSWVKAVEATKTYLVLVFAGTDRYAHFVLNTGLTAWTLLTLRQVVTGGAGTMTIELNSSVVDSGTYPDGWGMPTGLVVLNDNLRSAVGGVSFSGFRVQAGEAKPQYIGQVSYDLVPSTEKKPQLIGPVTYELADIYVPAPAPVGGGIMYYVNGKPFSDFGITVEASYGMLEPLERKKGLEYEWPGQHGRLIDLSAPRFNSRVIRLKCWQFASGPEQFISNLQAFHAEFAKPGSQRLHVNLFGLKPMVYEVVRLNTVDIEKQWRRGPMTGTFELQLEELNPIKRVLAYTGPGQLSLTMTTPSAISIFWGDGQHDYDVYGTDRVITHTYAGAGTYYIILAGVLDKITTLTHNATLVWNQL